MASNLRELVTRVKECELNELSSLELMFEHIASVHHYIYYASAQDRTTAEYKEQCAYYFVLIIAYLARANALNDVLFTGLDNIDEAIKYSTAETGIEYKDVNRKVATYEMLGELANITWHFSAGSEPIVEEYRLRVVMLTLACALNYEVRSTTDANLADLVEEFLTKRGK